MILARASAPEKLQFFNFSLEGMDFFKNFFVLVTVTNSLQKQIQIVICLFNKSLACIVLHWLNVNDFILINRRTIVYSYVNWPAEEYTVARIVRMPLLVQDRQYLREQAKPEPSPLLLATPIEWFKALGEDEFLDGPVTPRVAVLDFDAESGGLRPGAKFLHQGIGKTVSCYDVDLPDINDEDALMKAFESDAFIQVNTFATVMKTIHFFESPGALGRRVTWAFDSPQLLVLPRAGVLANAFYERESGSLQFFYCPSCAGYMVYSACSRRHNTPLSKCISKIL